MQHLFPVSSVVRQHAPSTLSAASMMEATIFGTLKRQHGTTLVPQRNLHVLASDGVRRTIFPSNLNSQVKYDHHDHEGRCNLNDFPLAKDRLSEVKDFFRPLFAIWDSEQQREGGVENE